MDGMAKYYRKIQDIFFSATKAVLRDKYPVSLLRGNSLLLNSVTLKLKRDANRGGKIAGVARKELEKELGRPVVSKKNYLPEPESRRKKLSGK